MKRFKYIRALDKKRRVLVRIADPRNLLVLLPACMIGKMQYHQYLPFRTITDTVVELYWLNVSIRICVKSTEKEEPNA